MKKKKLKKRHNKNKTEAKFEILQECQSYNVEGGQIPNIIDKIDKFWNELISQ